MQKFTFALKAEMTGKCIFTASNFEPTNMSHVNEIKGFLCQRNDVDLL